MLKAYLRRFHRWLTLVFALPLIVVIGTGLILSFDPLVQQARPDVPVTLAKVEEALSRFDPQGRARSLGIRTMDGTLTIGGAGSDGSVVVDLRTGEQAKNGQRLADFMLSSRRIHERLLLDLGWLVVGSTIAMLLIAGLGLFMGWPRFLNTLGGWHQGAAWIGIPLIVLSPLTGLALAFGITFMSPAGRAPDGGRATIAGAVRLIAADHDLANLTSIRVRGGMLMARIYVDGELRGYRVTSARLELLPRNWPRLIHEGNWGRAVGSLLNILTSLLLFGLLANGLTIWARRTVRKFSAQRSGPLRSHRAA